VPLNVILVLFDSLNRNMLEPYGGTEFATPNLARFAARASRFDSHFVGSLPCMPARREMLTGCSGMQWRPWGPLEPYDQRLPKLLERAGYSTAIVTDHYHYWEESANGYIQAFETCEMIRGHELDFWKPSLADADLPQWVKNVERWRPGYGKRYYSNIAGFKDETDYFSAKVMTAATDWLAAPRDQAKPFFLQVECFDVHEPFDAPEPYASLYGAGSDRDRFTLWPPYQNAARMYDFLDQATPEEMAFIRAQYGAKLTMADRWFGKLLDTLDAKNLWDDTVVIVTTDHGHDLGDHGGFGKQYPHHDSHTNIPLLVWDPRHPGEGRAVAGLTTTLDLFASVLDVAGVAVPDNVLSRSLMPMLAEDAAPGRDAVIYGTFGQGLCCTDGEWTLMQPPDRDRPLFAYSSMVPTTIEPQDVAVAHGHFIPGVATPQWKIPISPDGPGDRRAQDSEPLLYHRAVDPGQTRNLFAERPDQAARMRDVMRAKLAEHGAPPELFERLHLV
jgi:arylsulfatase A-like enzyme